MIGLPQTLLSTPGHDDAQTHHGRVRVWMSHLVRPPVCGAGPAASLAIRPLRRSRAAAAATAALRRSGTRAAAVGPEQGRVGPSAEALAERAGAQQLRQDRSAQIRAGSLRPGSACTARSVVVTRSDAHAPTIERACAMLRQLSVDPEAEAIRQRTATVRVDQEKVHKTSFFSRVHLDGLWSTTSTDLRYYGLVGSHISLVDVGRVQFFGPPGILLLRMPDVAGSHQIRVGYTWGLSVRLVDLKLFGATKEHDAVPQHRQVLDDGERGRSAEPGRVRHRRLFNRAAQAETLGRRRRAVSLGP